MSAPRRDLARRRRRADARLEVEFETESFRLWLPDPDDPMVIADFAEAAALACDLTLMPVEQELLLLLDAHRRVTALLLDPPAPVGLMVGMLELPTAEVEFSQTLSIVIVDHIDDEPAVIDREGYLALRRVHMLQGLQLLDVILVDDDRVQSLAITCDPDPAWFDPFEAYDQAV